MKKNLLKPLGKFYKAALHCHTDISDGCLSPLEVKKLYKDKGYSIVAFTDHDVLCSHYYLKDDDFLPITAYEEDINQTPVFTTKTKSYHFNLYSKNPYNTVSPVFNVKKLWLPHMHDYVSKEQKNISFETEYSVIGANKMIEAANKAGFFVAYNHPTSWSLQDQSDYSGLKGLWGVECFNHGSFLEGYIDSFSPFETLLCEGQNVFPLATDDMHHEGESDGGFVMVNSKDLEYASVIDALLEGNFYSSQGPYIFNLYLEDNYLYIKCSPAKNIIISTDRRLSMNYHLNGDLLEEAKISLSKFIDNNIYYFRLTLIDYKGLMAFTRAFYLSQLV